MDFTYDPSSWGFRSADHCQDQIPILSMVGKGIAGDSYKVTMEENDDGTWVLRGWKRTGNSDVWVLDWETSPMYHGDIWSTWYLTCKIAKALGVAPEFVKRLLNERDYKDDTFGNNADGKPRDTKEYIDDMDDEVLDEAKDYTDAREAAIRQWANLTFALIGHLHDDRYSKLGHTHDDRYYTESEADGKFAPKDHNHDDRYYTESEADGRFAPKSHTHDDRYYTESEVDGLLSGKANVNHNHNDLYYTETEINNMFGGYLKKADFKTWFYDTFSTEEPHSYNVSGSAATLTNLGFDVNNRNINYAPLIEGSTGTGISSRVEWHDWAPLFVVKLHGIIPTDVTFKDQSGSLTQNTSSATQMMLYKLPEWATPPYEWQQHCIGQCYIRILGKDSGSDAGKVFVVSLDGTPLAGMNVGGALSMYAKLPPR